MAGTRTLKIEVLGDAKGVSKAFGAVENSAGKMDAKLSKASKGAALALGGVAVAAGGFAAILAPKILDLGAQLETIGIKSETVFEGSSKDVEKWAKANAKAMGLTSTSAVGLAANMGDLLKPMGFTAEQAAAMSTEMVGLSGALSAWSGGTIDAAQVSDILTKAMLGETDGLKALGISISAAEVASRLAANGQSELTGAALAQAEAIATQQLILEKSTDAQKAWSDGSMDAMKAQMSAKASIDQVKETLVTALYPALQAALPFIEKLATWMGTNLPVAMEKVNAWVKENWPQIKAVIVVAVEEVRTKIAAFVLFVTDTWKKWGDEIMLVIRTVWPAIREMVKATLETIRGIIQTVTALIRGDWSGVWDGLKTILSGAWEGIKAIIQLQIAAVKLIMKLAWEAIKDTARNAWNGFVSWIGNVWGDIKHRVRTGVDGVVDFVGSIPGRIAGRMVGAFDSIKEAFRSAINWIITKWNGLSFSIDGVDTKIPGVGKVGGFSIGTPNISTLHDGGFVGGQSFSGLAADEVAAILRRGEVVLTRSQQAGVATASGPTFQISGMAFGDESVRRMFSDWQAQIVAELRAGARG
jgi:hypothetical protein